MVLTVDISEVARPVKILHLYRSLAPLAPLQCPCSVLDIYTPRNLHVSAERPCITNYFSI